MIHLSYYAMDLKVLPKQKLASCIHNHSWTFIFVSIRLWNLQLPECQFFQNQFLHFCPFTTVLDVLGWPWQMSWLSIQPFLNSLHHFWSKCAPIMPSPHTHTHTHTHTLLSTGGKFSCGKHILPIQTNYIHKLPHGHCFQCHCRCTSTYPRHDI